MSLSQVEAMVRDHFGLDAEALGATAFPRAVEQRMSAIGATTINDYLLTVTTKPEELQALAAKLVVAETWFFRGGRALFDSLAEWISARSKSSRHDTPARILSAPCSTGEEPFSLAIALNEHPVRANAYCIEGVDLSEAHLSCARAGRFGSFSFRETGPDIRITHFQQSGDRWDLRPAIRDRVLFRIGNATDPNFLGGETPFDLILCRNLFIYLTADARRQALANLDRLLAADGRLVLSPAEADRLPSNQFVAAGPPEFGIYRRSSAGGPATRVLDSGPMVSKVAARPATSAHQSVPLTSECTSPARLEPIAAPATLETARKLADSGRLADARGLCLLLLAQAGADPNVYSLLGAVDLAEGHPTDAAESFRKALYLDPNHSDALGHMIVICDSKGDLAQATALRKRLARQVQKEPT